MSVRTRSAAAAVAGGLILGVVPGLVAAESANAATTTRIAIRPSHSVYVAGQTIKLGIHLLNAPNGAITVYQTIPGHSARAIYRGSVDAKGYEHISGGAKYSSLFTVKYAGDASHSASSDSTRVSVRALVVAAASGGKKSGKYRSYASGKKAKVAAAAGPAKGGKRLTFRLQRLSKKGHWQTRLTNSYKLNSKGATAISVTGLSGRKYRVRAEYAGDRVNASKQSSWVYVRFRK